eukprot:CAMPEP_0198238698 /NCGR_PEP_ID=MMETSP1446-20131203/4300_1 /TAXON_ID=1461542 ORGANISM="Unidentified sp, Strain CCMP2111" /NCGR_SAMPLE_ID=MMETSP1446 /ASSEMBLY_ACC=CAM_ASM_001112 /LENGTH=42 /DNA_ID= /DNA_START= /DNA_END= /DNA_ORIENTATION=
MAPAATWSEEEISGLRAQYDDVKELKNDAVTKYNPTPGTGRT